MKNKYYVYCHHNPFTGEVFYIGKGSGKRAFNGLDRSYKWKRYVDTHGGFISEIIKEHLTEDEAYELEKEYIDKIGPEQLVNVYVGGRIGQQSLRKKESS